MNKQAARISDTRSVEPGASMSTTETKVRHTPGPWTLSQSTRQSLEFAWNVNVAAIPSGNPMRLAIVPRMSDEDSANANVIAAAPDMLEALEKAMRALETIHAEDDISIDADILTAGRAAIAKAKGGAA